MASGRFWYYNATSEIACEKRNKVNKAELEASLLELVRLTSTVLPPDVIKAIEAGFKREKAGSPAKGAFGTILESCILSKDGSLPVCQDTGALIWHVHYPDGEELLPVEKAIKKSIAKATKLSYLRPNAVDPVTGANSGTNLGNGAPSIHYHPWKKKFWEFRLMLKGGGCENVGATYKLPDGTLGADRDLDGVYKCVIDGIYKAQGRGCAPGVICVGVGGNRESGMAEAKEQAFRKLDDVNPDPLLSKLEKRLMRDANKLGIGPMGYGGKTTVLGVKAGKQHRLPACYFVSIAYMCWADRRAVMTIKGGKVKYQI